MKNEDIKITLIAIYDSQVFKYVPIGSVEELLSLKGKGSSEVAKAWLTLLAALQQSDSIGTPSK